MTEFGCLWANIGPMVVGMRILCLEHDPGLMEHLPLCLQDAGHEVETYDDGFTAVTQALAWRPDLLVLPADRDLPQVHEGQVLAVIGRRSSPLRSLPIVLLTADEEPARDLRDLYPQIAKILLRPLEVKQIVAEVGLMQRRPIVATRPAVAKLPATQKRTAPSLVPALAW